MREDMYDLAAGWGFLRTDASISQELYVDPRSGLIRLNKGYRSWRGVAADQSGEIQKVGSEQTITVDVRVLTGTHKDLKRQVAEGGFREDLLYRLNVLSLRVPSLRERGDDISLLARFFALRSCERSTIKDKPIDDEVPSN
jgi:Sigma-54 interaction domain